MVADDIKKITKNKFHLRIKKIFTSILAKVSCYSKMKIHDLFVTEMNRYGKIVTSPEMITLQIVTKKSLTINHNARSIKSFNANHKHMLWTIKSNILNCVVNL